MTMSSSTHRTKKAHLNNDLVVWGEGYTPNMARNRNFQNWSCDISKWPCLGTQSSEKRSVVVVNPKQVSHLPAVDL